MLDIVMASALARRHLQHHLQTLLVDVRQLPIKPNQKLDF